MRCQFSDFDFQVQLLSRNQKINFGWNFCDSALLLVLSRVATLTHALYSSGQSPPVQSSAARKSGSFSHRVFAASDTHTCLDPDRLATGTTDEMVGYVHDFETLRW
jgi:hypothetical protein